MTKLSLLPLMLAGAQADAASISFYLDQSNASQDGISYAQVTISDSTAVAGDIDFTVELVSSELVESGANVGMQTFSFNHDPALNIDASNIISLDPSLWSIFENSNAGGGFGKYDFQLSGNGSTRTDLLSFSISGIDGDSIHSYAMGSELNPSSGEYFAAHIVGFNAANGAKFAGSTVVPVPAAAWLFGSGLLALFAIVRRKQRA